MRVRLWNAIGGLCVAAGITACGGASPGDNAEPAQAAPPAGVEASDWPMYRGDLAGTGFSPLAEITPANVSTLTEAWRYELTRTDARPDDRGPNSQATPIVVDGVMYVPAADRVVALDPGTGTEHWRHQLDGTAPSRRGVSYWPGDDATAPRIVFVTGATLRALDAGTGQPVATFGDNGIVALDVPYNSVPLVFRNVVVIGANTPPGTIGGIGNARAYDARTGEKRWEFESVAQPGQVGHDTWAGDSWQGRLGANAWPFYFTADVERELIYLPLASPIPGYYGGDREGANLYGNAVVAVDAETGSYVWHFQTIHHDLWDADPPAPPALFDIVRDGSTIPALGVTTKSGYLYILNRETGEPIYDVEERPVAASDVPGEQTYPTQPIPSEVPPMGRTSYASGDFVTTAETTAEHVAACETLVESLGEIVNEGPFTPWAYRAAGTVRTTLNFPGGVGGPNWGGVTYDPGSGHLFVMSMDVGALGWMVDGDGGAEGPYRKETPRPQGFEVNIDGTRLMCQKPPWGQLTAVDGATGAVVWQRPLGVTDMLPEGQQDTGRPARAAAIATASGLLFIAATDDNRFRALDAATGDELWVEQLDARGNANPMTYAVSGRQYVVIIATDSVVVYALP